MKYIVNQYDVTVIQRKGKLGWPDLGIHANASEVISIEGNIQGPERRFYLQQFVQAFRNPHSAGMNSDHRRIREVPVLQFPSDLFSHRMDERLNAVCGQD
jgi:hypothetical protein